MITWILLEYYLSVGKAVTNREKKVPERGLGGGEEPAVELVKEFNGVFDVDGQRWYRQLLLLQQDAEVVVADAHLFHQWRVGHLELGVVPRYRFATWTFQFIHQSIQQSDASNSIPFTGEFPILDAEAQFSIETFPQLFSRFGVPNQIRQGVLLPKLQHI